jgi:hypothetical protein
MKPTLKPIALWLIDCFWHNSHIVKNSYRLFLIVIHDIFSLSAKSLILEKRNFRYQEFKTMEVA